MSPMMSHFKRIACYNIVINITYNILSLIICSIRDSGHPDNLAEISFCSLGLLATHVAVLLIIAIIYFFISQGQKGLSYLITMVVVLLLGGGMCYVNLIALR